MKGKVSILHMCCMATLILFILQPVAAQDQENISVSAEVNRSTVPRNKHVALTIELKWQGPVDRYEIVPFENPDLTNFSITGNATSSLQTEENGTLYSKRIYEYTLQPEELGMAYINPVIVRYVNEETGKAGEIETHRIPVEVQKAVVENGGFSYFYLIGILLLILILAETILIYRRKKKRKSREKEAKPALSPEQECLKSLRKWKPGAGIDLQAGLGEVTRILKRYFMKKFNIMAGKNATGEFIGELEDKDIDENTIKKLHHLLERSDKLKFSGQQINPEEYEMIYGNAESIIKKMQSQQTAATGEG